MVGTRKACVESICCGVGWQGEKWFEIKDLLYVEGLAAISFCIHTIVFLSMEYRPLLVSAASPSTYVSRWIAVFLRFSLIALVFPIFPF